MILPYCIRSVLACLGAIMLMCTTTEAWSANVINSSTEGVATIAYYSSVPVGNDLYLATLTYHDFILDNERRK